MENSSLDELEFDVVQSTNPYTDFIESLIQDNVCETYSSVHQTISALQEIFCENLIESFPQTPTNLKSKNNYKFDN
jgi:hypothetical protein